MGIFLICLCAFLLGLCIGGLTECYRVQVRWGIKIGPEWSPPRRRALEQEKGE